MYIYAKAEGLLKYPLPSSKGIILRSIQRIICSLHTHEPEMKISKLARRVWDNLRRAMYGRIGMQRIQVPIQFINKYIIVFQTQIRYWIFEILYLILDMGWYCIFSFFGIHTSRHSTVPADEKYKAPGTFSGGCKTFVHMSKNLLDIRVLCLLKQEMSCHLFQGNSRQKFSTHHLLSAYSGAGNENINIARRSQEEGDICMEGKGCREFRCDRHIQVIRLQKSVLCLD